MSCMHWEFEIERIGLFQFVMISYQCLTDNEIQNKRTLFYCLGKIKKYLLRKGNTLMYG
jgi:hypothetical protein